MHALLVGSGLIMVIRINDGCFILGVSDMISHSPRYRQIRYHILLPIILISSPAFESSIAISLRYQLVGGMISIWIFTIVTSAKAVYTANTGVRS